MIAIMICVLLVGIAFAVICLTNEEATTRFRSRSMIFLSIFVACLVILLSAGAIMETYIPDKEPIVYTGGHLIPGSYKIWLKDGTTYKADYLNEIFTIEKCSRKISLDKAEIVGYSFIK